MSAGHTWPRLEPDVESILAAEPDPLARLAAGVTAPGGFLFLASCSHHVAAETFREECARGLHQAGRDARLLREAGAAPDHPVHPFLPETAYLKALVFALD